MQKRVDKEEMPSKSNAIEKGATIEGKEIVTNVEGQFLRCNVDGLGRDLYLPIHDFDGELMIPVKGLQPGCAGGLWRVVVPELFWRKSRNVDDVWNDQPGIKTGSIVSIKEIVEEDGQAWLHGFFHPKKDTASDGYWLPVVGQKGTANLEQFEEFRKIITQQPKAPAPRVPPKRDNSREAEARRLQATLEALARGDGTFSGSDDSMTYDSDEEF